MAKKNNLPGRPRLTTGPKVTEVNIADLVPDNRNANQHTEKGDRILGKSLRQLGAGRSILVDKNNRIIAGNATAMKCAELGFDKAIEIETDGHTLVIVKRKDLDLDSKKGREMALADNHIGQKNLSFDFGIVDEIARAFDIDGDFLPQERTKRKKPPVISIEFESSEELEEHEGQIAVWVAQVCPNAEIKVRK